MVNLYVGENQSRHDCELRNVRSRATLRQETDEGNKEALSVVGPLLSA